MRRMLLPVSIFFLVLLPTVFAQTLQDYVKETRGDTLVIKDDFDYGSTNTLYLAIQADTVNVPAGRVYAVYDWGYYSIQNNPGAKATRKLTIVGLNGQSLKTRKDEATPPILTGSTLEGNATTGGMSLATDSKMEVKNCSIEAGNALNSIGWGWFGYNTAANTKLTVDNCMFEHTLWILFFPGSNSVINIKNSYFLNLAGYTCRRNGGVLDFFANQDTILVENTTHINTQGSIYKTRNYKVNRVIFNHNNFIDCSGYVFLSLGSQGNMSVTNNIFVNCDVQSYSPSLDNADSGEQDPDHIPMGLVNVNPADSNFIALGQHFYVDKNLAYWDPSLSDVVSTLNTTQVNGVSNWQSNMITMNTRTKAAFDNSTYPYLYEGTWFNKLPNFTDPKNLFTDELASIKEYSIAAVDTNYAKPLPAWRLVNDMETYFTYADWPVPIDLSYSDTDLMAAGIGGYPLGDLNWFPAKYTAWKAQRTSEYAAIETAVQTGNPVTAVKEVAGLPVSYKLEQNYPNPFNPTTVINFTIPKAGNVTLKVYNALGQEVATLVDEYKNASNYQVDFNASSLASGIYFYTLNVDNFTQTKKMMLVK